MMLDRSAPKPVGFGWLRTLARRWPSALALLMAVVTWGSSPRAGLAQALLMFALGYLVAAAVGRPRLTWLLAVGVVAALAVLRLQHRFDPFWVLLVAGVVVLTLGVLRGRPRAGLVLVEAGGVAMFAFVGIVALAVDPEVGRILLGVGWMSHAVWDLAHWWLDRVVSRSFAEWCGVFDLVGGLSILVLPLA